MSQYWLGYISLRNTWWCYWIRRYLEVQHQSIDEPRPVLHHGYLDHPTEWLLLVRRKSGKAGEQWSTFPRPTAQPTQTHGWKKYIINYKLYYTFSPGRVIVYIKNRRRKHNITYQGLRLPRGYRKTNILKDRFLWSIAKGHIAEFNNPLANSDVTCSRIVFDLELFFKEVKHVLHVDETLLDHSKSTTY